LKRRLSAAKLSDQIPLGVPYQDKQPDQDPRRGGDMKIPHNSLRDIATVLLLSLSLCLPACGVPTQADQREPLQIDSATVQMLESFPVQVQVLIKGTLADGCTVIDTVDRRFDPQEGIFWVEIDSTRTAGDDCIQAPVPFEEVVPLDVYGLPAGTYMVDINGVRETFGLNVDNVLPDAELPNPASLYCQEQGYMLEIRSDEQGNQVGVCVFPDGSECDEWAFFRGECGPAAPSEDTGSVPSDWATYAHGRFGYQFSYPPDATLREAGVQGFPTDELPEGKTMDEYVAELEEAYGDALCVSVGYGLGYVNFSAPVNQGFRYATCGRTGVGAGEMIDKSDTIVIAGQSYTATGFEFIGDEERCEALYCHNETFVLQLPDGTRIEYGAAPSDAAYEEYLASTRDVLLQIVASFVPGGRDPAGTLGRRLSMLPAA
jgi:putative hemolysin